MIRIILTATSFFLIPFCWAQEIPSENKVLNDYYYVYLGYKGKNELDTTIYHITDDDFVFFPDEYNGENSAEDGIRSTGFDHSEIKINYYEGYYTDTLQKQCVVLISPDGYYPAGPAWGLPCAVMILYTMKTEGWALTYVYPFYHKAQPVVFEAKSKRSLLFVRIDYGAMGVSQWIESIHRLEEDKPVEIYYELTSSRSMYEQCDYEENKRSYRNYKGGDTLGDVILMQEITDNDSDGVKELICTEELVISAKPRRSKWRAHYYFRKRIYDYKDGQLLLRPLDPFIPDENND